MFAIIRGTISRRHTEPPRVTEVDGLQRLSFLLNTEQWVNGKKTPMSVMVYHRGVNLSNQTKHIYAGRHVEVRGDLSFGLEKNIITLADDTQKEEPYLKINVRTSGLIIFLDENPLSSAENLISMMHENKIITDEQKVEFTSKTLEAIKKGGVVKTPANEQQKEGQQRRVVKSTEDANDLGPADPEALSEEDKVVDEGDIPR